MRGATPPFTRGTWLSTGTALSFPDVNWHIIVTYSLRLCYTSPSGKSRPALGPTQPRFQWVLEIKQPGREGNHFHLMPRLRIRGALPPPPYTFFTWRLVKE
jgi:hypothetical protein